jgi:glycosyltransferase involved in cell wall biosynthesis
MVLFFWHNIISPHQAPFMRHLAEMGHEVVVVATEAMSEDRASLGWEVPHLGRARVILAPDVGQVSQIIESSDPDSIHMVAGARWTPLGEQATLACRMSKRRTGMITETPDPRGVRGCLRWIKYSRERIMVGRHFNLILAMGQIGVRWFRVCGYPAKRIFPFAYVTDRLSATPNGGDRIAFRFLYVGQLIPRKGVDLLLRAFAKVVSAELFIIGNGPEEGRLREIAQKLGISQRVRWLGQMDAARVHTQIAGADVLVLPSRHDGWGAVVNEALMAGTPVICSTACGASELIQQSWLGTAFETNRIAALASALSEWKDRGRISTEQRARIQVWARNIEAASIAQYVEKVMAHVYEGEPRPPVPWRGGSA